MTKLKDIKGIQQQNNYTNQILGTISTQMNRIEGKLSTRINKIEDKNDNEKDKKFENPLFKPIKPLKLGGRRNNDDLIKILTQKLTGLEVNDPSTSKNQVNFLSGSKTNSSVSETLIQNIETSDKEEEQIIKDQKNFTKDQLPQI